MNQSHENRRSPIRSFLDLEVYQLSYACSLEVVRHVLPWLPSDENDDLKDQIRRAGKAVPRLIAEGYSKKHQKKGFQKYLDDALAESNEMIVSVSHARDLYAPEDKKTLCDRLIRDYTSVSKMTFTLRKTWDDFGGPPRSEA